MQRIFSVSLIALALVASGCQSSQMFKDSWKFTKRQYTSYLNTPASLDMDDKGSCAVYELALGEAVMNVDSELSKLIRAMENSDHNPDQAWVMQMLAKVPWLSGVALVGGDGKVEAQYPEHFAKGIDAKPLLEPDPKQRLGALRAYVQMHPSGPEVYVANPVYGEGDLRGLIVAHFDPAALATMSNDPGSFVLASPAGVIWPGRYGGGPMSGENWEQRLSKESCGIVGSGESAFFWTTRYVGNLPIVYGMPVSAAPSVAAEGKDAAPAQALGKSPAQAPAQEQPAADGKPSGDPAAANAPAAKPRPSAPSGDTWHEPSRNPAEMDTPGSTM